MLTRLEVDGFKNLLGFSAEFGPYTCIAGPNGTGKSNIFDAIRFLSLLADHPLMEAAQRVRSSDGRGGDPRELFWTDGTETAERVRFLAEMVVPREVKDDFGRVARATITLLRYELELRYEPPTGLASLGHLVLHRESLEHINVGDAAQHLGFAHSASAFRKEVVQGRRSGQAFISTRLDDEGRSIIQVHQDGGSRGQPKPSPADLAPRTIVGTTTQSSDPTILAARREMQSWRRLALEPAAMRSSDRFVDDPHVAADGAHLAATLYRLATRGVGDASTISPADTYAALAARLSALVNVAEVRVDRDDRRELLTLEMREQRGAFLPARSLSDGTLRFLALCLLDLDPTATGVLCMEEPENGIHPARMLAMVELVRGLAVDPHAAPSADNPMRQLLVNTHSPHFVQLQNESDLLFASVVTVQSPRGRPVRTLRLRPIDGAWRCRQGARGVSAAEILDYLTAPPGAQLSLLDEAG